MNAPRYPLAELKDLPDDIRTAILAVQEKAGFVPNVFLGLARRPAEWRAFFAYHDALMLKEEGSLTKGDREMIVTATSAVNQCLYCVVAHGALLRIYEKKPLVADQVAVNYRKADITQYRHWLTALVAVTIISRSPLVSEPSSFSISASWYAKKARHSAGRRARPRNTLGTKPAFSCTARIAVRMSSGRSFSSARG